MGISQIVEFRCMTSSMTRKKDKKSKPRRHRHIAVQCSIVAAAIVSYALIPRLFPNPMNTSIRDGSYYIRELLEGHPNRFYNKFGMSKHVFQCLASELHAYTSFQHSKHISMAEQLAIFLSFCRTGNGFRVIQEDFQHSVATVSR